MVVHHGELNNCIPISLSDCTQCYTFRADFCLSVEDRRAAHEEDLFPGSSGITSHGPTMWRTIFVLHFSAVAVNVSNSSKYPTPGRDIEGTLPVSHMSTTGSDGGSEGVWRNVNMFRNTGEASKGVFYERVILVQSAEHLRWSCRNVRRTFKVVKSKCDG